MNLDFIRNEPVLLGAALAGTADGICLLADLSTTTQGIVHGITVAWIAWIVRILSTPTKKVDEQVEAAKYVGAVEHQATAAAGVIIAHTRPAE